MVYRRYPGTYIRQHPYSDLPVHRAPSPVSGREDSNIADAKLERIPLPNEEEGEKKEEARRLPVRSMKLPYILESIKSWFGWEELLLVAVILLLFTEDVKDELLLIIMAFILLG